MGLNSEQKTSSNLITTCLISLGFVAVAVAILGLGLTLFTDMSGPGGKTALATMCVYQLIIGSFLAYGAHLKKTGSDLAPKVYPASIAATVLFIAFASRWLTHG